MQKLHKASSLLLIAAVLMAHGAQVEAAAIPAGTKLLVQTEQAIDSKRQAPGSRFSVVLQGALSADGAVVAPAGTKAFGRMVEATQSRRLVGQAELTITLTELTIGGNLVPIKASGVKAVGEKKGRKTARKVAAGAAIGAMFGGGKGAAYGAAAGATASLLLQGNQINIPGGTLLEFTLAEPVTVPGAPPPKPQAQAAATMDPTSLALSLAKVQGEQDTRLKGFNWNQRTQVEQGGKVKMVRLELIRFDADGEVQRTKISEDPKGSAQQQKLVGDIQELREYVYLSSGSLLDFLSSAKRTSKDGKLIAEGSNVRSKGDSVRLTIDEKTHAIERAEITTKVSGDDATGQIDYQLPGDKPGAPIRAKVEIPKRKVKLTIEAFTFNKN